MGVLILMTPLAAVAAMLAAPRIGGRLGRVALPVAAGLMALAFTLPGQTAVHLAFALAMMGCGAATGLTDVLMNARTAQIENERGLHLMNLCHAAYSFGYAGAALGTGALRNWGWGPGWVMGTMAAFAFLFALATWERDGRIHGLTRPKGAGGGGLGLLPAVGGAMVLVAFLTENAAENWSALHIEKTLGGSPAQGALGPAALALTMGFARLAGQGLAGRVRPFFLLKLGAVVAACGALIASQATSPAMAYAGFVVMGIGEPFDNYDNVIAFLNIVNHAKGLAIGARHITVSTSGLAPKIREFAENGLQVNLALSLHAPNDEIRSRMMRINRKHPLKEVMALSLIHI